MKIFDAYAKYYDLLYKDKNYCDEVDYIEKFIKRYKANTKKILDLGCGTGKHDFLFAKRGYEVTGIELSERMIEIAKKTLQFNSCYSKDLKFLQADIRNITLNEKFDFIVALFHVMSYQVTNEDINSTLEIVKKHLKDDGFFLFDFWYGPAVLIEKPELRVKKLENDEINIERFAKPELKVNENLVDVNYKVFVKEKNNEYVNEIKETHRMRYFFIPEIKFLLERVNLNLIHYEEWMTGIPINEKSWSVLAVAGNQN